MPRKYRCSERKRTELKKIENKFNEYLKNMRKTYAGKTVKYESISDISSAVWLSDKEEWNKISEKEKTTFLSEIKSFQEEFQEDGKIQKKKLKEYWLTACLNSFVEQKKNDGDNEIVCFFFKEDFEESLGEVLIAILYFGVEEWENMINPGHLVTREKMEKLGLKPHGNKEEILLERIKNKLFKYLGEADTIKDKWIKAGLDFLFKFVFANRNFWNIYYDYKMQYKEVQSIVLSRWMNPEDILNKKNDEYEINELKRKVIRMIYGHENAIQWYMPENAEDFFEYNYERYSYHR